MIPPNDQPLRQAMLNIAGRYVDLILATRRRRQALPRRDDPMDPESRTGLPHLRWMCEEAIRAVDAMPSDKAHRWLGFVQGAMSMNGNYAMDAVWLMTKPRRAFPAIHQLLSTPRPRHGRGTLPAILAEAEQLREMCEEHRRAMPTDEISRWLGALQGRMAVMKLIDVDGERVITRPLFHAAYEAMGLPIPESWGPGPAAGSAARQA